MTSFRWLHLTDIHQGMSEEKWLWPNVQERFFEDLRYLHEKCGPWDLVLFTGDLTQRGNAEEFQKLNGLLEQLWRHLAALGSKPELLAVPGNHDLVRPDEKLPAIRLLRQWANDREMQEEFWADEKNPYRQAVNEAFQNYAIWWQQLPFRTANICPGMLPGDFSTTIEKDGAKLGIVGLNTSFLQLDASDYEKKLALHTRQFHAACKGNGPEWAKLHHACFLLTHHPPAWLDTESQQHLYGEICAYGRFALHLCGHQHESVSREVSEGGTETRRIWQGRSLFDLESLGGHTERSHGYAAGVIELDKSEGFLTCWPRRAEQQGWERNLVPDYSLKLTDTLHTPPKQFALLQAYAKPQKKTPVQPLSTYGENANRTDKRMPAENHTQTEQAKTAFRQIEQENFLETETGTRNNPLTAKAVTALLPYLLNRHPQIAKLVDAIRMQRTNGPLLCFLHGNEYECHDKLIDRFADHTLPGMEPDQGRNSVMRCRIECDLPGDREGLHRHISMSLGELLLGNLAASREEIAAAIVQQRCSAVLFTDMHTKNWMRGGGVKTLHDFIAFWADWPVPVERLLLVCLSFYYTEPEKSRYYVANAQNVHN